MKDGLDARTHATATSPSRHSLVGLFGRVQAVQRVDWPCGYSTPPSRLRRGPNCGLDDVGVFVGASAAPRAHTREKPCRGSSLHCRDAGCAEEVQATRPPAKGLCVGPREECVRTDGPDGQRKEDIPAAAGQTAAASRVGHRNPAVRVPSPAQHVGQDRRLRRPGELTATSTRTFFSDRSAIPLLGTCQATRRTRLRIAMEAPCSPARTPARLWWQPTPPARQRNPRIER